MTVTDPTDAARSAAFEHQVSERVEIIAKHRAFIEQAKGMLMFIYGIDANAAFDILRSQSQDHNVKLHLIAEQMVKDLLELTAPQGPARRLAFDVVMFSAHERIAHVAARQLNGECKTGVPMKDLQPNGNT